MYAIIRAGGHQHRVAVGETIEVERMDAEDGAQIELGEVLLVGGDAPKVGLPVVEGAVVRATVVGEVKGEKVVVFKYRPKNRYRVKTGHRQRYLRLKIDAIDV